jgi:hypothetical protein
MVTLCHFYFKNPWGKPGDFTVPEGHGYPLVYIYVFGLVRTDGVFKIFIISKLYRFSNIVILACTITIDFPIRLSKLGFHLFWKLIVNFIIIIIIHYLKWFSSLKFLFLKTWKFGEKIIQNSQLHNFFPFKSSFKLF